MVAVGDWHPGSLSRGRIDCGCAARPRDGLGFDL